MPSIEKEARQDIVDSEPAGTTSLKRNGHDAMLMERQHLPRCPIGNPFMAEPERRLRMLTDVCAEDQA